MSLTLALFQESNTIQAGGGTVAAPPGMAAPTGAPAGVVAVSQTGIPMSPPGGILIQNPPAISYVSSTPYIQGGGDPNAAAAVYQGNM